MRRWCPTVTVIFLWSLVFILGCAGAARAAPADLRRWLNSARAWGCGGCAVNLVDEESALHNPGAVGVFHLHKNIGFGGLFSTEYAPKVAGDEKLNTWNVSLGINRQTIFLARDGEFNLALAASYAHTSFVLKDIDLGEHRPLCDYSDDMDTYTFGLAAKYFLRVGVGYARQAHTWDHCGIAEDYDCDDESESWGVLAELPLLHTLQKLGVDVTSGNGIQIIEIEPSIAFVKHRALSDVDRGTDLFPQVITWYPETEKLGFSVLGTVGNSKLELGSVRFLYEREQRESWRDTNHVDKIGFEGAVAQTLYFRIGKRENDPLNIEETYGFGIGLRGFFAWLDRSGRIRPTSRFWGYIARRLDISFDYAKINGGDDAIIDNSEYYKLRISL